MSGRERVYLDWNATAPLRSSARDALLRALDAVGNPASTHAEGRAARALVEDARAHVAALVGADPRGVVFVGGATEALTTALSPRFGGARLPRALIGATEHECARAGGRFAPDAIATLPVDSDGLIDSAALDAALAAGPALVAVQAANGETGVIQDTPAIARRVRMAGGALVVDAAQAAGRIPLDLSALGADALVVSSHKLGGPMGVGALIYADPDRIAADPLLRGGGQERGARAGTQAAALIAAFGAAAEEAQAGRAAASARMSALRDGLEADLAARRPGLVIFGASAPRLPNTTLIGRDGLDAATLLMALDLAGFAVSSGSACSSGKVGRSAVLAAMGVAPALARSAIRVSIGPATSSQDLIRFAAAYEDCAAAQFASRERRVA